MQVMFKTPKTLYKELKIHRSVINKQLKNLDSAFPELKNQLRRYLTFIDLQIQEYEDFFKEQRLKHNRSQLNIFDFLDS